ncbi:MAG: patatin-like phospholipase family protein [Bacteroidota bacterium]|nr:patatin-like phospholipase family protein [Bacteroidota bacterium]
MKTKIGIALSGGGARGIAHLGILKALEEFGIKPNIISGTSAGAIVGAFYAGGYTYDEMIQIVDQGHFFNFTDIFISKPGLFSMKGFEEIYSKYFPGNSFKKLKIPLFITATDILKGELKYLSSGNLSRSLMASSCIPFVFEPVSYNNTFYIDGGVLNNFPIEPLVKDCDIVIGVYVNSIKKEKSQIQISSIIDRSFHLAISNSVNSKVNSCDLFISPPDMSQFGVFELEKSKEIFEYGYQHCLSLRTQIEKMKKKHNISLN